jgi:hypothetical protein
MLEADITEALATVRYEEDYRSGTVYHGGRDFDTFDPQQIGTALGNRGSYMWATESLANAGFYDDGAIHEGHIRADLAAFADARNFPGMPAAQIANEIYFARCQSGENVPDCYVISGMTDGSHRATVMAVVVPAFENMESPAFDRTRKHLWNGSLCRTVKVKAAGNCLFRPELAEA